MKEKQLSHLSATGLYVHLYVNRMYVRMYACMATCDTCSPSNRVRLTLQLQFLTLQLKFYKKKSQIGERER